MSQLARTGLGRKQSPREKTLPPPQSQPYTVSSIWARRRPRSPLRHESLMLAQLLCIQLESTSGSPTQVSLKLFLQAGALSRLFEKAACSLAGCALRVISLCAPRSPRVNGPHTSIPAPAHSAPGTGEGREREGAWHSAEPALFSTPQPQVFKSKFLQKKWLPVLSHLKLKNKEAAEFSKHLLKEKVIKFFF